MAYITIERELCKECGLCVDRCPKKLLEFSIEINNKGYHPVEMTNMDECIGCAACALTCPDICIEVYK